MKSYKTVGKNASHVTDPRRR